MEVPSEIADTFDGLICKRCALCQYKITNLRRVDYDTIDGIVRDVHVHKIQLTQVDKGLGDEQRWQGLESNIGEVVFHPLCICTSVDGQLCKSWCHREALVCDMETLPEPKFAKLEGILPDVSHREVCNARTLGEVDLNQERTLGNEFGNGHRSDFLQFTEFDAPQVGTATCKCQNTFVCDLLAALEVNALQFWRIVGQDGDSSVRYIADICKVECHQVGSAREYSYQRLICEAFASVEGQPLEASACGKDGKVGIIKLAGDRGKVEPTNKRSICKRGVPIFEDVEEVEEGICTGEVRLEPEELDGAFAPFGRYEET